MSFRNLNLKPEYDSIQDDIYNDFFNKVLKISKLYSRFGGKFTSKNFAICAEGMQGFIQNDGLMKLVLLPEFSEQDINSINSGINDADSIISEKWIEDFSQIQEKFVKDHVKALAWMIANNNLEIKIIVPVHHNGSIADYELLENSSIFKNKVGIFWDVNHHSISFSGDVDFSDKILGNFYRFRVYRSWDMSERKYLDIDFSEFSKYWDGEQINSDLCIKTLPLPLAIKNHLIEIAPKSKSEIKLHNLPQLRQYQIDALNNWIENDYCGIFEMATGTGKTFTAIGCIDEIRKKLDDGLVVIIVCPSNNLERQWQSELEKWGYESNITSSDRNWAMHLDGRLATMDLQKSKNVSITITTYKTFSTDKFIRKIERTDVPKLLIADEVHNAGSYTYRSGLNQVYDYRLGLSATLERYFDPDGTRLISDFFKGTAYSLDLATAIPKFLVEYYYYPIYVDLTEEEYEKYIALTKTIARLWNSKKHEDELLLEVVLNNRAHVIRDAQNKIKAFSEWVKNNDCNIMHLLVYCSESQIQFVKSILTNHGHPNCEITAKNPKNPADRIPLIEKFGSGLYRAIVANKVLDEGADIPSAKNCILLASTGNPKQFIQRRGRVLRKFNGRYRDGTTKDHAQIYDILVIPNISEKYTEEEIRIERRIVESQLKRQEHMAKIAINKDDCMKEIEELKRRFKIP